MVAECFFLDVGQGTSNVVLLGGRRAIVIDCGRSARIPLELLRRYVDHIVALMISHNDRDHHGGAAALITAYPNAIDRVYFLQDRPIERLRLFAVVQDALARGLLTAEPVRLERGDGPSVIYADDTVDLSLEVLFPRFVDNLTAQLHRHPNATSGVLALFCGHRKIVFAGDSTMDNWHSIREHLGAPIRADILAVPHHGGDVAAAGRTGKVQEDKRCRVAEELRWLYCDAIHPEFAVVSTGTVNDYGHPNRTTIRALCEADAQVLCTQITPQCHSDVESLRPGVIRPNVPSASRSKPDYTSGGHSRNLACASTVIAEVAPEAITIRRLQEHRFRVDAVAGMPDGHPLCRTA
jgi:beta-lactamase superfamily II metal-dependent hydrolase